MTEKIEHVVIGAGPAGLRAAQTLAEAGREVVVLEKNDEIGPKTCAGGLTPKAVRELIALGLPADVGLTGVGHASFREGDAIPLDPEYARISTVARRALGRFQASLARRAGAELRTGTPAARIDPAARTLDAGGRRIRYRHLIGADGSRSTVRRTLGLPTPRAFFAAEYNVPGLRLEPLLVAFDSRALASGYFWVFPHRDYTSFGAGAPRSHVRPAAVRGYLERRMANYGVDGGAAPFEGATIEVDFVGFDFPDGVHLAGEAAGTTSGLTAEGIYGALISGEEVARRILEPSYPRPKCRRWLRTKRVHDALGRIWFRRLPRELSFAALEALFGPAWTRHRLSRFFLMG